MKLLKFRRDGSIATAVSKLFADRAHFVSITEAYVAVPGTRAIEVTHPLRGFTLSGLLAEKKERFIVAVEEGDGYPLQAQYGYATAYRSPTYPAANYDDLIEHAAYWEAQNKQAKRQGGNDRLQFVVLVGLVFLLAVPIVVLAMFGALPAAFEGFQGAAGQATGGG